MVFPIHSVIVWKPQKNSQVLALLLSFSFFFFFHLYWSHKSFLWLLIGCTFLCTPVDDAGWWAWPRPWTPIELLASLFLVFISYYRSALPLEVCAPLFKCIMKYKQHRMTLDLVMDIKHNMIEIHDSVMWDWQSILCGIIPTFSLNVGKIPRNVVSPIWHCYGFGWCRGSACSNDSLSEYIR